MLTSHSDAGIPGAVIAGGDGSGGSSRRGSWVVATVMLAATTGALALLPACGEDDCRMGLIQNGSGNVVTMVASIRCGEADNIREGKEVVFETLSNPGCPCHPESECSFCSGPAATTCDAGCVGPGTCNQTTRCVATTGTDGNGDADASLIFRNPTPGALLQVNVTASSELTDSDTVVVTLGNPPPTATPEPTQTPTPTRTPSPTTVPCVPDLMACQPDGAPCCSGNPCAGICLPSG